jgi:hypothetical protein
MTVTTGFVSFTEVDAGEHHSYNQWHLFDHLPEQLPLPGIVWGQRWVLPPAARQLAVAPAPLERVHYVTLYLMAEPPALDETLAEFRALGVRLHDADRFHRHRRSHLSGPITVETQHAVPRVLVSPEAVPYRPGTGVHVRITSVGAPAPDLGACDGVAGVWTFTGDAARSPESLRQARVTWCWLDGDVGVLATALAEAGGPTAAGEYRATFATIDPFGSWDWFEGSAR